MRKARDDVSMRNVLSRFATGVTIVTSREGDDLHGMTCNAFCSVSLSPPKVLVSLTKSTRTAKLIARSRIFAVNILSQSQTRLSDRFAGRHHDKETDRFEGHEWTTAVTGSPIFQEVLAYLDCELVDVFDGGDHGLYLGHVVDAHVTEGKSPLVFYKSKYQGLEEQSPAS